MSTTTRRSTPVQLGSGNAKRAALTLVTALGLAACGDDLVTTPEVVETGAPVVRDLSVSAATDSSVVLRWTAVGDDEGQPADYEVRYGPTPIGTEWSTAEPVPGGTCAGPIEARPGRAVSCTVGGLTAGRSYDFLVGAFRQADARHADVKRSNVATAKTAEKQDGTGATGPGGASAEPAGFTMITNRPFDQPNEDGWSASSGLTAESDGSAPASGPGVLKVTYPVGYGGGYAPIWSDRSISGLGYRKLYVSFTVKLSSNWQGHQTGTNKIGFVWLDGDPNLFFNARGKGSGTLTPAVSLQGVPMGAQNLMPNVGTGVVKRGEWQRWEAVLIVNEAGKSNGEIHLWVDGVKLHEHKGLNLSSRGSHWETLTWRPIWGGAGDSVKSTQYMWMDHYYASGSR